MQFLGYIYHLGEIFLSFSYTNLVKTNVFAQNVDNIPGKFDMITRLPWSSALKNMT